MVQSFCENFILYIGFGLYACFLDYVVQSLCVLNCSAMESFVCFEQSTKISSSECYFFFGFCFGVCSMNRSGCLD